MSRTPTLTTPDHFVVARRHPHYNLKISPCRKKAKASRVKPRIPAAPPRSVLLNPTHDGTSPFQASFLRTGQNSISPSVSRLAPPTNSMVWLASAIEKPLYKSVAPPNTHKQAMH